MRFVNITNRVYYYFALRHYDIKLMISVSDLRNAAATFWILYILNSLQVFHYDHNSEVNIKFKLFYTYWILIHFDFIKI